MTSVKIVLAVLLVALMAGGVSALTVGYTDDIEPGLLRSALDPSTGLACVNPPHWYVEVADMIEIANFAMDYTGTPRLPVPCKCVDCNIWN